ncbi:DUF3795 domain-containing protein [bacterium]|nr:DUF3795 domain-containing protein [bacterium]
MDTLKYVTYCGLYCKLCANIARIPNQAYALRDTLAKSGWTFFGDQYVPEFREFWKALGYFSDMGEKCPGCRGECGYPGCTIRPCARERKVEVCSSCDEFPCDRIKELAGRYPNLISDGFRQRAIGLDRWIAEQEERCATGLCYNDFRYPIEGDE